MAAVSIRKATEQDAGDLASLIRELGWFNHLALESAAEAGRRVFDYLTACLAEKDSHSVYVAETNEAEIAGYVAVHWLPYLFLPGPEGYVSELFVRESARGQGIGTKLLATVQAEGRERGCFRLMLLNNRRRESYERRFYEKVGWQERGWLASFILPLAEVP